MKILTLLVAILLATPANGQEIIVFGLGGTSCGKWLESRSNRSARAQYKQWVFGFVSGSNWNATSSQAHPMDSEALIAFIDTYCVNNPLHPLSGAAAAAVQETGGPKASHQWKP